MIFNNEIHYLFRDKGIKSLLLLWIVDFSLLHFHAMLDNDVGFKAGHQQMAMYIDQLRSHLKKALLLRQEYIRINFYQLLLHAICNFVVYLDDIRVKLYLVECKNFLSAIVDYVEIAIEDNFININRIILV